MPRPNKPHTKARWWDVPADRQLTPQQVADAAGVTKRYIFMVIHGERPAPPWKYSLFKAPNVLLITRESDTLDLT